MVTIPKILLDPANDNELVQLAYERIQTASGDTLTDFRAGSPLAALVEGQVFAIAELLYYLNLLPEAIALEVFRIAGVQRQEGTKSTGYVRFLLSNTLSDNFIINPGYTIPYNDTYFVTTEQLLIPAGAIEGDVLVESVREGSDLNIEPFGLVFGNPGLNFVESIFNPEAITGGTDLEILPSTIERAQQAIRSRGAVSSISDYETAAQNVMGEGSRAKAIPLLNSDKLTESTGHVHLFCCDANGVPITEALADAVKSDLLERIFAASFVWVSPNDQDPIDVEITATVYEISEELADNIANAVLDYLSPLNYEWGDKVRTSEISYRARGILGVLEIDSVNINELPVDHLLPNRFTAPFCDSLVLNLLQSDGTSSTFYRGLGLGDPE